MSKASGRSQLGYLRLYASNRAPYCIRIAWGMHDASRSGYGDASNLARGLTMSVMHAAAAFSAYDTLGCAM